MGELTTFTIQQAIEHGRHLCSSVSDSAKLDSQVLLAFCLEKPTSYLFTWPEKTLANSQQLLFESLVVRRVNGEPIAYITGEKEFWSLPLKVSPATLIPRPDTEVLVEQVLLNHKAKSCRCLDLGTGTGAIALALATEKPNWQIEAVDFQEEAVELASENVERFGLQNVSVYQSDWFAHIDQATRFDIIVSNPPYIDKNDQHLLEGDVAFEPKSALVAEKNGLSDIQKIVSDARRYLMSGGYLYIEHGCDQAFEVQSIFSAFDYHHIQTVKDYNNNDRVTLACYHNK
ncbi:peptide chain release factor N(5)-glutamine methyltransferase [Thalassotalea hakodatensis]|uniref:peptide chain release factor N(5)-glutamine methyltransferase n=1 Tax=Thalassotalea hakodatensis TaxID=3030492 RepID=UPI0025746026|nr:peptide chain release factor N(5)-glutamine methyltransferase [Thalassotalea hakodatensis]